MLISTHSLHHTQCSIHSASVSSFSVLVYPFHRQCISHILLVLDGEQFRYQ